MSVRIVTDSASCLDSADTRRLAIAVVPLHVTAGGVDLPESSLREPSFYDRLAGMETLPTTSQPSPAEFAEAFRAALAEGHDVLAVVISAGMSSTFEAATSAAATVREEYPDARVEVLDSRSNSLEEGFAVLAAAEAAAAGEQLEACRAAAERVMRRTRFLFAPHSLEYLRRGGRISGASALVSVMLKVAPVLTATNGATGIAGVARGSRNARTKIAALMRADVQRYGLARAVVQYVADEAEARRFAVDVVEPIAGGSVPVVPIHPVVGLHVGPAVGVVYETVEQMR